VITGCVHVWKNVCGVNDLNHKTISTLLSLPLYIACARMNTELQLIIYLIDEKSVWTVLVIALSREYICKHSVISVELLSLQTTLTQNFCIDLHMNH
jgi:hypothetical protein